MKPVFKSIISLFLSSIILAFLTGCALPLPDPDYDLKKVPPPPQCICTGICEGYELPKQLDCPCFPPICPTADLTPALALIKDDARECRSPMVDCLIKDIICQIDQGTIFAA